MVDEPAAIEVEVGTLVDGLAAMMLFTVTLISLLVHIYSTEYLHGDRRFTHYYAFLSLFTASMLFYVIGANTLQMLVGWELVGVCSFVLIGHWWEEKANTDAALKAFLTNRVGDVGLLLGVIILFFAAGQTFNVLDINEYALTAGANQTCCCSSARSACSAASRRSRASSRCTPGCPTPWPAPPRCRRSSTPPPWSSPAST